MMVKCSWCHKETLSNEITYCKSDDDEKHNLCSSCHLSGHACQSSCPSCWHDLAQLLIIRDCLCAGCIKPLDEKRKFDDKGHSLCIQCQKCILCSFRQEIKKEFFSLSYREHEPRIQNILYLMQICVQRMEIEREPCSICIEPLYGSYNNPVKILDICQHRFHSKCIEKWFKEKPCCPCCRHVYQNHDEPKFKRSRRDHFNVFHSHNFNYYGTNTIMDTYS
ncbi:unnamed protein product [Rotaria sordida]|uniref:RING-type domain-containing protein n=1 Tax=Rotaria sordida TaxID=392033 RepID=A0A818N5P2_9BILA|nr:unnamed protein product [Rotaria sordida]CAF3599665.1 unnamed protein product [Rotaria sordida]